jgi:hypothetical protein
MKTGHIPIRPLNDLMAERYYNSSGLTNALSKEFLPGPSR